jgi:UDP-N-acetylglucosamine--N-acetylmuramyl-(pentapeptide) pyrophosphoryl-undecaprenol N-acetylglucosamine transferase
MGGGTAGHLFPSVAVAQRLVEGAGAEVLFIGAEGRLDAKILSDLDLPYDLIPAQPFPYGLSLRAIPALWTLLRSIARCKRILRQFEPDVVFGAGGYVSVAGVIAASRLGIPSVCHVSDAQPDRANRLLARWATRITTHFEAAAQQFPSDRTTVTGQPVRREFLETNASSAREALGIPPEAFTLVVAGGSQGARTLNYATLNALEGLLEQPDVCVIHLTGALDFEDISRSAREKIGDDPRYLCLAFHEQPWLPLAAADLCLTRAGASSLAEMAAMAVPMIIVPYPYAAAHQKLNAAPLVEAGAALLVDNADLTGDWLLARVRELKADRKRLADMSEAAKRVSRPHATEHIADAIQEVA